MINTLINNYYSALISIYIGLHTVTVSGAMKELFLCISYSNYFCLYKTFTCCTRNPSIITKCPFFLESCESFTHSSLNFLCTKNIIIPSWNGDGKLSEIMCLCTRFIMIIVVHVMPVLEHENICKESCIVFLFYLVGCSSHPGVEDSVRTARRLK